MITNFMTEVYNAQYYRSLQSLVFFLNKGYVDIKSEGLLGRRVFNANYERRSSIPPASYGIIGPA